MSTSVSIRRATEADADSIARLAGELGYAVHAKKMRSHIRTILASAADLLIVAVDSSSVAVGWLQAHAAYIVESGFRVEITGLIVSPASRRRGVGRSLVAHAEHWAMTVSAEAVVVRSNAKRVESHTFYPALGYTSTKTQVVYRKPLADASNQIDRVYPPTSFIP
jgi:predicted N-acetyltransferase YhbS